jgi:hypothetical protein
LGTEKLLVFCDYLWEEKEIYMVSEKVKRSSKNVASDETVVVFLG